MSKKRILLTGDDGYNSPGIRLVIAALRDHYDLHVAGTFSQQSAVGGSLSIENGFDWGLSEVDGVPAFWVKGSPSDAVELTTNYFGENSFDMIISGINWGGNLGAAMFASGTFNAAVRAIATGIADKGIALSWDLPTELYIQHNNGEEKIEELIEYPGKMIKKILDKALENNLWESQMLNVNLPKQSTSTVKFTKIVPSVREVFAYNIEEGKKLSEKQGGHFSYGVFSGQRNHESKIGPTFDVGAVNDGVISITPIDLSLLNNKAYEKIKDQKIKLD